MFFEHLFRFGDVSKNISEARPLMEDFFIDHVDTEYCFRAVCRNIPTYINTALTLKHQISKRIDRRILSLRLIQWNMAPLRQYYSARNCIHIFRRYGVQFPVVILINIITMQQIHFGCAV